MKTSNSCPSRRRFCAAALLLGLAAAASHAQGIVQCPQIPCDDVRTVAAATTGVPVERDFNATAGTTYYVTLTDFGAQFQVPQPLATLKLAITANDALVSLTPILTSGTGAAATQLVVDGTGNTATNGAATAAFTPTTSGAYRIHVVGAPQTGNAPGPIGVQVSSSQSGSPLLPLTPSAAATMGPAGPAPPSAEGVLQQSFTITAAGPFQISVTDLALPQSLQGSPQLIVLLNGTVVALLPDPNNNNALTTTATLQPGTYQVFALALAASGASGGLFTASVIPVASGGGAPASAWTIPVGSTSQAGGAVQLSAGAQYSLSLSDLAFPAALSNVAAIAVDATQGTAAASLSAAGTQTFTAAGTTGGDTYQIYTNAQAAGTPGAGAFSTQILSGSTALTGAAEPVTTTTSSLHGYSFSATMPAAASYTATLTDFQIPAALSTADLALVQGGAVVGTVVKSPGSITSNLVAGPLTLIAFATSSTAAGSLMDVSVNDSSSNIIFDQPQGVGVAFKPTQISITNKGSYQFTLTDLAWPATFSQSGGQLTGILTQGGTIIGEIFGGGTLSSIAVNTTGNYYLNIVATPTGPDLAGTYALNASAAPPAPTVSLSADATSVAAGGTVHLIWTTTNATNCVASGGTWSGTFTGSQAASDSVTSPAISGATTFTLTCTGPGGTTAGTVAISLAAASSSKGGGGAIGEGLLLLLGACAVARRAKASPVARPASR